jgi:hypothetical protein
VVAPNVLIPDDVEDNGFSYVSFEVGENFYDLISADFSFSGSRHYFHHLILYMDTPNVECKRYYHLNSDDVEIVAKLNDLIYCAPILAWTLGGEGFHLPLQASYRAVRYLKL